MATFEEFLPDSVVRILIGKLKNIFEYLSYVRFNVQFDESATIGPRRDDS